MPYFTPPDFTPPIMPTGGTSDARLNKTLADIANGVPPPRMTWSGQWNGGISFEELAYPGSTTTAGAQTPVTVGGDFMAQYQALKATIADWLKQIDRSFDPATWGVTNPDGSPVDKSSFSWSDPATWPPALWAAFKPYAVAIGLVLLAVLLIGAGFWKSIK